MSLFPNIVSVLDRLEAQVVQRQPLLDQIANYIASEIRVHMRAEVVFICTHNSRRSQLAQVWVAAISAHLGLPVTSYSGGTEVTAFHPLAIQSLREMGLQVICPEEKNPECQVTYAVGGPAITCYSKLFDDTGATKGQFIAIMTCSEADEACPNVPGAKMRFSLPYLDPGRFDRSDDPLAAYIDTSTEILSEWYYILQRVKAGSESGNV